eukprot:12148773-Alexandrium_andersonii.AAC.1
MRLATGARNGRRAHAESRALLTEGRCDDLMCAPQLAPQYVRTQRRKRETTMTPRTKTRQATTP